MDQFVACWEGLEDPRTGNAGLHDFHELLMIALCTVLSGGQGGYNEDHEFYGYRMPIGRAAINARASTHGRA